MATSLNKFLDITDEIAKGVGQAYNKAVNDLKNAPSYDDTVYNTFRSAYPSYSTSSYGGGGMIDLSNMMKAYEQGAQSQKEIAKQDYTTKREDLLTSLKRFQEQNARDVQNQQKTYLSNQASLESAIAQADRQNRISAAARGLGGSGLQQLAQLQNLLSQGQTISNMATENQEAMDTLRRALSERETDTNTAVERALADYTNRLNEIDSNLAANKANVEYQAREAAASRAASAANTKAQIEAQYDLEARKKADDFKSSLSRYQTEYDEALKEAQKKKSVGARSKAALAAQDTYKASIADLLEGASISSDNPIYSNAYKYNQNIINNMANQDLNKFNSVLQNLRWIY